MEIRKPYTREAVQVHSVGETRTKQSFKKECDINVIMAKYQKTGAITHFSNHQQQYGIADGQTFQDAMIKYCQQYRKKSEQARKILKD